MAYAGLRSTHLRGDLLIGHFVIGLRIPVFRRLVPTPPIREPRPISDRVFRHVTIYTEEDVV